MVKGAMLPKVCSRSHGQPSGARRRAMMASSSSMRPLMRSSRLGGVLLQQPAKGHQHACGRAPDIALPVGDVVHIDGKFAQLAAARLMIRRIQDEAQGHFEYIVNFGLRDAQLIVLTDEAD